MKAHEMREVLRSYRLRPRKELGQSFLLDEGIAGKIVDLAELTRQDMVLEIGAGLGILTELLLARAGKVVAVEVDTKLCDALRARLHRFSNLTLLNGDILKLGLKELLKGDTTGRSKVVSNLPYQITSRVLNYVLANGALIELAVLTLQDEVARRVVAQPGTKDYGLLSVLIQYHSLPEVVFSIEPSSFYPSPRVLSTVIRLRLRADPAISVDERLFFRLLQASFSQRRKMLKNALRTSFSAEVVDGLSSHSRVDLRRRAETLSLSEFGELTEALSKAVKPSCSEFQLG